MPFLAGIEANVWAAGQQQASNEVPGTIHELAGRDGFVELSDCEDKLLNSVITGQIAYCGPPQDSNHPDNDPEKAQGLWGRTREVRSELIRWLVRRASPKIDPRGLKLDAARISGKLDLSYVAIPFPLSFIRSYFTDEIELEGAIINGYFLCQNSTFEKALKLPLAKVTAFIDCEGARFHYDGDWSKKGEYAINIRSANVTGAIWLNNVRTNGAITLLGTHARALSLVNAEFGDIAFLTGMKVDGDIN